MEKAFKDDNESYSSRWQVQFFFNSETNSVNPIIGEDNYSRITVPPMIWFGFKGLSQKTSFILNISNELYNPLKSNENLYLFCIF